MEIGARTILEALGTSYQQIKSKGGDIQFLNTNPASDMLRLGKLDGYLYFLVYPTATFEEVSRTVPLKMLPVDDKALDKVSQELGVEEYVLPADTFSFQPKPIKTVRTSTLMVVRADMPDQVAYDLTKTAYANYKYIQSTGKLNAVFEPAFMVKVGAVELHPGAKKFFAEAGLLK
jgi:TRAP transporter TAXI family solute receptor